VVLEVLVDVERVEVLGVEAGEEHVDDDRDVDLLRALAGQVAVGCRFPRFLTGPAAGLADLIDLRGPPGMALSAEVGSIASRLRG
jgi:hypothetical protein